MIPLSLVLVGNGLVLHQAEPEKRSERRKRLWSKGSDQGPILWPSTEHRVEEMLDVKETGQGQKGLGIGLGEGDIWDIRKKGPCERSLIVPVPATVRTADLGWGAALPSLPGQDPCCHNPEMPSLGQG